MPIYIIKAAPRSPSIARQMAGASSRGSTRGTAGMSSCGTTRGTDGARSTIPHRSTRAARVSAGEMLMLVYALVNRI